MVQALVGFFNALVMYALNRMGNAVGYVMDWANEAHYALAQILRRLLMATLGVMAIAIGASYLLESVMPLLIFGILYPALVAYLLVGVPVTHAAILVAIVDILQLRLRGKISFHSHTHESGLVHYHGTDLPADMLLLQMVARFVGWIVLIEMMALLFFAAVPVWLFPAIPLFLVLGLILHAILQINGFQNAVTTGMVWVLVAVGITGYLVWTNPHANAKFADLFYGNDLARQESAQVAKLRSDIDARLIYVREQIRALEYKDTNGTITPEERVNLRNWRIEEARLMSKAIELMDQSRKIAEEYARAQQLEADAAAAQAAGNEPVAQPAVIAPSQPPADPGGFTVGAAWGYLTGLVTRFTADWPARIEDMRLPQLIVAVILIVLLIKFLMVAWTLWFKDKTWNPGLKHLAGYAAAVLIVLALYPVLVWATGQIEKGAQASQRYARNRSAVLAAPSVPTVRETSPSIIAGPLVLREGWVTRADLDPTRMFDTGFVPNQDFVIQITSYEMRNGGLESCGAAGCVDPQLPGNLICPEDNHMSVIGGNGVINEIGTFARFRLADMPDSTQTFKLSVNQAKTRDAWANMEGRFYYQILADR